VEIYTQAEFVMLLAEEYKADACSVASQVNRWLARGDGAAVYRNQDLGHPEYGAVRIASFGSPAAQLPGIVHVSSHHPTTGGVDGTGYVSGRELERAERAQRNWMARGHGVGPAPEDGREHVEDKPCPLCPPEVFPDMPGEVNFRYRLAGTYKGEPV
jgi:hypothetical protein